MSKKTVDALEAKIARLIVKLRKRDGQNLRRLKLHQRVLALAEQLAALKRLQGGENGEQPVGSDGGVESL